VDHPANPISSFPIRRGSVQSSHSGLFLPDRIGSARPFGGDSREARSRLHPNRRRRAARRTFQVAWEDHRKPEHPRGFREADELVRNLISTRDRLLIMPQFSTDTREGCQRCVPNTAFPLADSAVVLSVLGYC
jgi:hypothetical protein